MIDGHIEDDKGLLDIVPLNIIYPEANPKGEIPKGTDSDVESDDDQLITRKSKTTSLGGAYNAGEGFFVPLCMKIQICQVPSSFWQCMHQQKVASVC